MTPEQIKEVEQKAKELIDDFTQLIWETGCTVSYPMIKQVCIKCVDEILNTLNQQNPNFEDNTYWSPIDFWQQVKQSLTHPPIEKVKGDAGSKGVY